MKDALWRLLAFALALMAAIWLVCITIQLVVITLRLF